jgi:hypothetical protein
MSAAVPGGAHCRQVQTEQAVSDRVGCATHQPAARAGTGKVRVGHMIDLRKGLK